MKRILLAVAALALLPLLAPRIAHAQGDEQTLVDRATLAVQEMATGALSESPRTLLQRSRGAMICPRVFKVGLFFGGEGGACVLLARAGNGTWSYPAFFGMGSGSFGLQIGLQDSQFVMLIMTEKGLNAVMDANFKLGADASIAVATLGAGIQGSTTGALGADIIAFTQSRGLYGGITLEGSIMGAKTEWNRGYYGRDLATRQIVVDMQASNPGADPLREVLTRYGTAEIKQAASPPPPLSYQSSQPAASAPTQLQPSAPVQQQNLPPPR
jgi:lipid-binding SYLF domain-containing protein